MNGVNKLERERERDKDNPIKNFLMFSKLYLRNYVYTCWKWSPLYSNDLAGQDC